MLLCNCSTSTRKLVKAWEHFILGDAVHQGHHCTSQPGFVNMTSEFLRDPDPAPSLNIPASCSTVTVRVIDSTSTIHCDPGVFMSPKIKGYDDIDAPAFCFLVSNGSRHVLFDLGIRKDFTNLAPAVVKMLSDIATIHVEKNVSEILDEGSNETGVKRQDIEAIIWSHHHFDHTGDPSTFPPSTELIVGPGVKETCWPGYPTKPDGALLDSDARGRNVKEVYFEQDGESLKVGKLNALDFFGDGSFYLLDVPGHSVGHMCGLARVTTAPDSFILMGADAVHQVKGSLSLPFLRQMLDCHSESGQLTLQQGGEMRPTKYLPLPSRIRPSPIALEHSTDCLGASLQGLQSRSGRSVTQPFFDPSPALCLDHARTVGSIEILAEFDADPNIFVIVAHERSLLGQVDFFPLAINDWKARDLDERTRWGFCAAFESGVKEQGHLLKDSGGFMVVE